MNHTSHHATRAALIMAGALLSFGPPATADQTVYFTNGRAMIVKSIEKGPKFTILEIEGGGRIGVPTEQIARVETFEVSPPAAPAGMPVPVAQQPAAVPPVAVPADARPAVPSTAGVPPMGAPAPAGAGFTGRGSAAFNAGRPVAPGGGPQGTGSPQRSIGGPTVGGPARAYGAGNAAVQAGANRRFGGRGMGRRPGPDWSRLQPAAPEEAAPPPEEPAATGPADTSDQGSTATSNDDDPNQNPSPEEPQPEEGRSTEPEE